MSQLLFATFILTSIVVFSSCSSGFLRNLKGELFFFDDNRLMTLPESETFCKSLSGHLPSIHSHEDAEFLRNLISSEQNIWLAGERVSESPPSYKWTDGTPFDYAPWKSASPNCYTGCCGIALCIVHDVVYNETLLDCSCDKKYHTVCKITMSPGSLSQRINSLTLKIQILDREMQSFIALTDQASRNITEEIKKMQEEDDRAHEKIVRMITFLNSSIQVDERRDTVVVQAQQQIAGTVPPKGSQDSMQLAQLHDRLTMNTICLVIMSAVIVFLISIILYKYFKH